MELLGLHLSPFRVGRVVAPGYTGIAHLDVGAVGVHGELLQQRECRASHLHPVHPVVEHLRHHIHLQYHFLYSIATEAIYLNEGRPGNVLVTYFVKEACFFSRASNKDHAAPSLGAALVYSMGCLVHLYETFVPL